MEHIRTGRSPKRECLLPSGAFAAARPGAKAFVFGTLNRFRYACLRRATQPTTKANSTTGELLAQKQQLRDELVDAVTPLCCAQSRCSARLCLRKKIDETADARRPEFQRFARVERVKPLVAGLAPGGNRARSPGLVIGGTQ
jgi:hypothetical protein